MHQQGKQQLKTMTTTIEGLKHTPKTIFSMAALPLARAG